MKVKIYYGLGGSFNDTFIEEVDVKTEEQAINIARECAVEIYESYEGLNVPSWGCIKQEQEEWSGEYEDDEAVDDFFIDELYQQEIENWILYGIVEE